MTYIKAKKLKMGQIFRDEEVIPVTLITIENGADTEFEVGSKVKVSGKSKGKGFQGVVKRHGFRGVNDATHGQHNRGRHPGSLGASSNPSRVFKGMKMSGQMGNERVKILNLRVVKIISEQNLLLVKGSVPGANGSYLIIEK